MSAPVSALTKPPEPAVKTAPNGRDQVDVGVRAASRRVRSAPRDEAARLAAIERRLLVIIQAIVYSGVILLTVGAGALSWSHLTHIAQTNGNIAPPGLTFLFPTIIDGFMVMGSAVVVRHALTDDVGGRTWYAGALVAATASLSICLNIQDSTGQEIVPAWVLPGIAPALYMLGTELGLAELRLLMRKLRSRIQAVTPRPVVPAEPPTPSKKEMVLDALAEAGGNAKAAMKLLSDRRVQVDRSYVYEIRREMKGGGSGGRRTKVSP